MKATPLDTDCVILGGGAVGTLVAMLAAERGYRCLVLRLSDQIRPKAETLRNQAWLQSGALFTRLRGEDVPSELSLRLRAQGQRLVSLLNLPELTPPGLARFPEDQKSEISRFVEDARKLGLGAVVRPVSDSEARRRTGPLYKPGTQCIEIPDAPFDEAAMLVAARARASAGGARFVEVDSPVSVDTDPHRRWRLVIEGERFRASRLVLAAGIGNLRLLNDLGVEHHLSVRRTPLLVIPRTEGVEAPIFIDRSLKLAVARHDSAARHPDGCLVIGVSVATEIPDEKLASRQIPRGEWEKIYKVLPPELQPDRSRGHRFTCGYEVMRGGPGRVRKEDLIVEPVEGYDGVVLALPGRATLAYRAAELVLEQLDLQTAAEAGRPIAAVRPQGNPWTGPINMHHQSLYDTMDERAEERP